MDSIRDTLYAYAGAKRDEILENCANEITDTDLDPADKPTRAEVSPGCLLKFADEVEIEGQTILYLCPGRGVGWFYGLTIEAGTIPLGSYEASRVSDRLPADANETPMPIFSEL